MPPRPDEGISQKQFMLRLRAAIDTAVAYPSETTQNAAISLATRHPRALRSTHVRTTLGSSRWQWLNEMGVFPIGEAVEIAGSPATKATYTPELRT